MLDLDPAITITLGLAGGVTAVAMLNVFANVLEHETKLHDLRNQVRKMHFDHAMYLARIHGRLGPETEEGEVEVVEENDPVAAVEAAENAAQAVSEALEPQQETHEPEKAAA